MKKRSLWILLLLLFVAGCGKNTAAPQATEDPTVESVSAVLEEPQLGWLDRYPNLRYADLSGSRCYDAMDAYADAHPGLQIRYTIPLGNGECPNVVEEVYLREGEYELEELLAALPHLRNLRLLCLTDNSLDAADLDAIRLAQPAAELRLSRHLLGMELGEDTRILDLSGYTMAQLQPEWKALEGLPALEEIVLVTPEGDSPYSLEDAAAIRRAAPQARLRYRFPLFGQMVDAEAERLEFADTYVGPAGLEQIRLALELMPNCSYLKLDDCGIDNETMAAFREEYRGRVKVVWRVHYGVFSDLTDTRVIHAVGPEHDAYIDDEMCRVLCYCEDTEYMDLGHNTLSSIAFCSYMPHLKMAILSYNNITDLSPLENCQELFFLEMFCCRRLEDLSPLSACGSLRMLNVSFSTVTDISPLYGMDLELLHMARTDIPPEQAAEMARLHPDCRITYEGYDIHELGWRRIREGEYYDWYLEIREIFGYGDPNSYSHK